MNKITSVRIDEDTLEKIKTYAEIEKTTMCDFMNTLLNDGIDSYFARRRGGAVINVNNPQFDEKYDREKYLNALRQMLKVTMTAASDDISIVSYMLELIKFYYERVLHDDGEDAERYKMNCHIDR